MFIQMSKFFNDCYVDVYEVIVELLWVQVIVLDMLKKKFGILLGWQSKGIFQFYQVEVWCSNVLLVSLDVSLSGVQVFWEGIDGKGLKILLLVEQKVLVGKIDVVYVESYVKLVVLEQKLFFELFVSEDGCNQFNVFYDSLNVVYCLYEGDLVCVFGV